MPTLAAVLLLLASLAPHQLRLTGVVEDASGAGVAGATVGIDGTSIRVVTGPYGAFTLDAPGDAQARLFVTAPGFLERRLVVPSSSTEPIRIVLDVAGIAEAVRVAPHARGGPAISTPASVTVIDGVTVASTAPLALDDILRSVPGFSLFRRSSSRVANPTTQGVTLRGMAASGASRTTVLLDDAPMTDSFGGWIQWSRLPSAAIERVEVARGGASDLFGGDAVGGAITMSTVRRGGRLFADAGSQGTARLSAFGGRRFARAGVRGGLERFTTDGYLIVAPESAGPIDTHADSRHTAAYGGFDLTAGATTSDIRLGDIRESRGNGTPFQTNATRTRHASARLGGTVGPGALSVVAHGAGTDYEQTFSAVLAGRAAERPTSAQEVESSGVGGSAEWVQPLGRATLLVGSSARETRAALVDQPLSTPAPVPPVEVDAVQRTASVSTHITLPLAARVTLAGGVRAEHWSSRREGGASATATNLGPRASIVYQHTTALSFRGSVQSGYRFPTINELYRDFRVGNALTQSNPELGPEESLGVEGSVLLRRRALTARASVYSTHLTGGIVNVTLQSTPSLILRQRRNAASIRARGLDLEADVRAAPGLTLNASVAFMDSTFTRGEGLDGLRVPQVPRVQAAVGAMAARHAFTAAVEWRYTSAQFDDDRNQFRLEPAGMVNARAGWRARRGVELFVAVENAFDVEQDVGRTPIRTIGMPRTARVGLRLMR